MATLKSVFAGRALTPRFYAITGAVNLWLSTLAESIIGNGRLGLVKHSEHFCHLTAVNCQLSTSDNDQTF